MNPTEVLSIKTDELHFDHQNPRLPEYGLKASSTEADIISILWDAMDARELVLSISASGFFNHEPLIVTRENDKLIVIEGNRRLAAVRLLLDPEILPNITSEIPVVEPTLKEALRELPCIIQTRESAWKYLGFKHVNGPAKWSSYAKAKYIADVHRNFGVNLTDVARQIGDTHKTAQRLYRGLMVIEQAEKNGIFNRDDRWKKHFAFSHMYTGLQYDGISSFLSLKSEDEEADAPVPEDSLKNLEELCLWLYGSQLKKIPPIVETQNPDLRRLNDSIKSRESLAAIRSGLPLIQAYELSRPTSTIFEEALLAAKRGLQKARSYLTDGFDGSKELLAVASTVADLADDLYEEMNRKTMPKRKRRSQES